MNDDAFKDKPQIKTDSSQTCHICKTTQVMVIKKHIKLLYIQIWLFLPGEGGRTHRRVIHLNEGYNSLKIKLWETLLQF